MAAAMSLTERGWISSARLATLIVGSQLIPAPALGDPEGPPQPDPVADSDPGVLHNVIYRARADGTSRGAVVAYKADDANVNSEQPTLLPGSTFEVNTVLSDPQL